MVRAVDKWQSRNDFRSGVELQRIPPGAAAGDRECWDQSEIAFGFRYCLDHARRTHVWHERNCESEMETCAVAHKRVTGGEIGMYREWRLHIGECRDNNAPDALRGIKRQDASVALHQTAHHVGFARRTKGRPALLRLLHGNEAVNNLSALHQQFVHRTVNTVDVTPQIGERWLI